MKPQDPEAASRQRVRRSALRTQEALQDLRIAAGQCAKRVPVSGPSVTRIYRLCRLRRWHAIPCAEAARDRAWSEHARACESCRRFCHREAGGSLCDRGRSLLAACCQSPEAAARVMNAPAVPTPGGEELRPAELPGEWHPEEEDEEIPF
jgi:hypothetical protein